MRKPLVTDIDYSEMMRRRLRERPTNPSIKQRPTSTMPEHYTPPVENAYESPESKPLSGYGAYMFAFVCVTIGFLALAVAQLVFKLPAPVFKADLAFIVAVLAAVFHAGAGYGWLIRHLA